MSIAISATILPSRTLLLLTAAMAVFAGSLAAYGIFSLDLPSSFPLFARIPVCIACFVVLAIFFYRFMRSRYVVRLDISSDGDIILRPMPGISSASSDLWVTSADVEVAEAYNVTLTPRTALWPHALFLQLRTDDGRHFSLPILWDSVQSETFHALSVTFRWIAVHHHSSLKKDKNDILESENVKY